MLDVIIQKKAERDLDALGEPFCSKIIGEIEKLKVRPWSGDIKKLKSRENEFRLRVGVYRVLFIQEGNTVFIARVLHRKDAYRRESL